MFGRGVVIPQHTFTQNTARNKVMFDKMMVIMFCSTRIAQWVTSPESHLGGPGFKSRCRPTQFEAWRKQQAVHPGKPPIIFFLFREFIKFHTDTTLQLKDKEGIWQ